MFVSWSQAANFDNWNSFVLLSGILALITAAVFILGSWKVPDFTAKLVVDGLHGFLEWGSFNTV